MGKLFKYVFVLDYAIIIFKLYIFVHIFVHFEIESSPFAKQIFSYYLIPYGSYAILNVARMFFRKNKYLLYVELALNIVYIFIYVFPRQLIFLILTVISAFIVLYPMRFAEKRIKL
jgi:hypothetical protein